MRPHLGQCHLGRRGGEGPGSRAGPLAPQALAGSTAEVGPRGRVRETQTQDPEGCRSAPRSRRSRLHDGATRGAGGLWSLGSCRRGAAHEGTGRVSIWEKIPLVMGASRQNSGQSNVQQTLYQEVGNGTRYNLLGCPSSRPGRRWEAAQHRAGEGCRRREQAERPGEDARQPSRWRWRTQEPSSQNCGGREGAGGAAPPRGALLMPARPGSAQGWDTEQACHPGPHEAKGGGRLTQEPTACSALMPGGRGTCACRRPRQPLTAGSRWPLDSLTFDLEDKAAGLLPAVITQNSLTRAMAKSESLSSNSVPGLGPPQSGVPA